MDRALDGGSFGGLLACLIVIAKRSQGGRRVGLAEISRVSAQHLI
jgi:hypothetical protein